MRITLSERTVKAVSNRLRLSLHFQEMRMAENAHKYRDGFVREHMDAERAVLAEWFEKTRAKGEK